MSDGTHGYRLLNTSRLDYIPVTWQVTRHAALHLQVKQNVCASRRDDEKRLLGAAVCPGKCAREKRQALWSWQALSNTGARVRVRVWVCVCMCARVYVCRLLARTPGRISLLSNRNSPFHLKKKRRDSQLLQRLSVSPFAPHPRLCFFRNVPITCPSSKAGKKTKSRLPSPPHDFSFFNGEHLMPTESYSRVSRRTITKKKALCVRVHAGQRRGMTPAQEHLHLTYFLPFLCRKENSERSRC